MAAHISAVPRLNRLSLGRTLKWVLSFVTAWAAIWFIHKYAFRYLRFEPDSYRHYWSVRWWLVCHILGGFIALVVGPFQLSAGLRRRNLNLHRWLGRAYLLAIGVGGGAGLYMALFHASPALGMSLAALDTVWLTCASLALISIRFGNVQQHRQWMIRSYVVTHGFVVFRLIWEVPYVASLGFPARGVTAGWFCWAVPLFITEIALQWRQIVAQRSKIPARTTASAVYSGPAPLRNLS